MRRRRIVLTAIGCGILVVLGHVWRGAAHSTVRVDSGPVGERIVAAAAVVPSLGPIHVYAPADGRVVRVLAQQGEPVRAGDALAELDSDGKRQPLRAPSAGVVLVRQVEIGDYVLTAEHGARTPAFELADPTQTSLRVEIEAADAARVALGQTVIATPVSTGQPSVHGTITRLSAQVQPRALDATSATLESAPNDPRVRAGGLVRIAFVRFDGGNPGWLLDTRAEVTVDLGRQHAKARVPRAALSVRDGRTVLEQPYALWTRTVPVEIGAVDGAYAQVKGIAPGSEVLLRAHRAR